MSNTKKSGPKAKASSQRQPRQQRALKTKAPKEIPPKAVKEYNDLMDGLVGPLLSASEGEDGKWEEEEHGQQEWDGIYADPDLLNYIHQLCAEEDFITKVEAVIHPRFLAELLSPGAHVDFLSLTEELQQEEGLTPTQLVEKRLLSLKDEEGMEAPPKFGSRDEVALQETFPRSIKSKSADGSNEEEDEELPSLAFFLKPPHQLLPWGLVKSPLAHSGHHTSGIKRARAEALSVSSLKRGHNQTPHPDAKSPNTALADGPSSAGRKSHLIADFGAFGRQMLVLVPVNPLTRKKGVTNFWILERRSPDVENREQGAKLST
nr:NUT family member 1-like [Dasypus novemcinctus]